MWTYGNSETSQYPPKHETEIIPPNVQDYFWLIMASAHPLSAPGEHSSLQLFQVPEVSIIDSKWVDYEPLQSGTNPIDRAQKTQDMRTRTLASVSFIPAFRFSKWRRTNQNLTRHCGRCQAAVSSTSLNGIFQWHYKPLQDMFLTYEKVFKMPRRNRMVISWWICTCERRVSYDHTATYYLNLLQSYPVVYVKTKTYKTDKPLPVNFS